MGVDMYGRDWVKSQPQWFLDCSMMRKSLQGLWPWPNVFSGC